MMAEMPSFLQHFEKMCHHFASTWKSDCKNAITLKEKEKSDSRNAITLRKKEKSDSRNAITLREKEKK